MRVQIVMDEKNKGINIEIEGDDEMNRSDRQKKRYPNQT